MKYDNGKAPLALVPVDAINQVAEVLGFGANKYGPITGVMMAITLSGLVHIHLFNVT